SVKLQAWSIRRKLRLVHQARSYVAQHEGALQERLAMSGRTKDLMARFKLLLAAKWQQGRRELANISTILIPWERRIKEIESHFGSVVASYFTFLRWLFWVNIVIAVVLTVFVVVPEIVATDLMGKNDDRKQMLPEEKATAANFLTIWDFEGFLKYSPLFYGYYSDVSGTLWGYKLPLAYFLTGLVVYIYSFVATLRKMAENSRMSKLSSKDDECVFSWKLFTGWDFMIGHAETAHNRVASVVLSFKEALLEEAEKKKDKRNWKVIGLRIVVNLLVAGLLVVSAYAVVMVVNRSTENEANSSWWRRNEITIVMSLISFFFPMFFEGLGFMESYHPRQQLRLQLARIMLLNLLNLYSLIFALFDKISDMNTELLQIKADIGMNHNLTHRTTPLPTESFSVVDFFPTVIGGAPMADYVMTSTAEIEEVATTFITEVTTASRSNNFYLALLLTMLFLCVLPVAFAIVWLEPSWHCGPFSNRHRIYYIFTETLRETLPQTLHRPLDYIASPSTVIPLLLLLVLIIYYLISLTNALREANQDLRNQLRRERMEERKKMRKLAENKPTTDANAPTGISERWRKVLENATSPLTPTGAAPVDTEENKMQAKKELLQRIMKKALRKSSATSDEDSTPAAPAMPADDETDTEQHDSLPHDHESGQNAEERDNRVNKQKNEVKTRESLPEILKKLREAAKKQKQEENRESPEKKGGNDHPLKKFRVEKDPEKTDRRQSLTLKKPRNHENQEFSVISEREKPKVFNFDLPTNAEEDLRDLRIPEKDLSTSEEEKDSTSSRTQHKGAVVCKEFTAPKSEKAKYGVIKVKKDAKPSSPKEQSSPKNEPEPVMSPKEPAKGMKKLNSFFNLVKEAIQAKKDQDAEAGPAEEVSNVKEEGKLEDKEEAKERSKERAKGASKVEAKEKPKKEVKEEREEVSGKSQSKKFEKPKRQDSVASIWSDNIPTITISKTESDECILEAKETREENKES
uniref:Transmembrane channel-like protein 3 n=2 Tax=Lutzomyia longipalpis TaxID=7200 RepID=A0A1B0CEB5_LUTLO